MRIALSRVRVLSALAFSALALAVPACDDAGPPPATPATLATAPVTTVVVDAGPAGSPTSAVASTDPPGSPSPANAGDGGADYYSCGADTDCVAVPKANCCPNGYLEAVNKQSVDAYKTSIVCQGRRICPQYRILDRRVALCGSSSHKCELTQPDLIICSGSGAGVRPCPTGSQCDGTGHCAPTQ